MASPTWLSTTASSRTTWTRTHTVTLPSTQSKDHLLLSIGFDGLGGTITGPGGSWKTVHTVDLNTNQKWRVYLLHCDGTEPSSVTLTSSNTNKSAAQVIRIEGGRDGDTEGTDWDISTGTTSGYGTIIDPDQVTATWGSADQLYVALVYAGANSPTVTSFPSTYSNGSDVAARAMVASATLAETSASDDPGPFMISSSNSHRAATFVLRNAATVVAGASTATATATALQPLRVDPPNVEGTATVAAATATAHVVKVREIPQASDLVVEWDLDNDGDFDQSVEDITDYVLGGSYQIGRDFPSQIIGKTTPGRMTLTLDNSDDRFNFFNASSPLNTDPYSLTTGRKIRLRTTTASPTDPTEIAEAHFNGSGPLTTADSGETWVNLIGLGFTEHRGQAQADGPPAPTGGEADENPDALAWSSLDNSTAFTVALRPATSQTISLRSTSDLPDTGDATTHDITLPATIEADDLIVIFVATQDASAAAAPTATGYTQHVSDGGAGSFRPVITILWKIATGSEDSTNVTLTFGASVDCNAVAAVFDGVDTTTPFDVASPPAMVEGQSNPNPPPITVATDGAWVIAGASANLPGGAPSGSVPSGYTLVYDQSGQGDDKTFIIGSLAMNLGAAGAAHVTYLACGETSYYAQTIIPLKDTVNEVGLCYSVTDSNNYGLVYIDDGNIRVKEVVSGTPTVKGTSGTENRDHVALGVMVNGTSVKAYLDGVEELSITSGLTATQNVGLYGLWFSQRPPQFEEFHVWDRMRVIQSWDTGVDQSGVLATMRVSKILPAMSGGRKTATLTAVGELGLLSRPITPPTSAGPDAVQSAGVKAGHMIGNALARLHLLHPPHQIDAGVIPLGSVGFDKQRAISVIRRFEETEDGFLYEAPDGGIRFDDRTGRDGSTSVATFTDDPNELGLPYETIEQRDWQSDLINEVTSEVSPIPPRQIFKDPEWSVTNTGTRNDVDYTIPAEGTGNTDAAVGDLMVVAIASTVQKDGTSWEAPTGWTAMRASINDEHGLRVYARRLTAGDFGDTVVFYDDSTDLSGGGFVLIPILVKNWYGSIDSGVALSEFTGHGSASTEAQAGLNDPPVMFTPWNLGPTLFVPFRAGMTSTSGATVSSSSDDQAPNGFDSLGKISVDGVANSHDVGLQWCRRIRTERVINPSPFGGQFTGYDIVETATLAVRGYAGDDPPASGGQPVTSRNTDSMNTRQAVLPHPNPGILFETIADAETYNDRILTRYDADRPILSIGFTATRSRRHRDQAVAGQLSDRITVNASNNAGLGVDADYFIETIRGSFDQGITNWRIIYDLSPVADPGAGAD